MVKMSLSLAGRNEKYGASSCKFLLTILKLLMSGVEHLLTSSWSAIIFGILLWRLGDSLAPRERSLIPERKAVVYLWDIWSSKTNWKRSESGQNTRTTPKAIWFQIFLKTLAPDIHCSYLIPENIKKSSTFNYEPFDRTFMSLTFNFSE